MDEKDTLYARWLSGELSAAEMDELDKSGEIKELIRITDAVSGWHLPKYKLEDNFDHLQQKIRNKNSPVTIPMWGYGAAAAIVVLVGSILLLRSGSNIDYSAGLAQTEQLTLEDGTSILLNDGSTVSYRSGGLSNQRKVSLTGEAFFQVTKGKKFIVSTDKGEVTVLGTEFNVRSWGNDLHVSCYEGSVQVTAGSKATILTALESVTVSDGMLEIKKKITESSPLWSVGISRFYSESIYEVIAEIERQYAVTVTYNGDAKNFSGQFEHDDLQSAVDNVCIPLGLSYEVNLEENEVIIQ